MAAIIIICIVFIGISITAIFMANRPESLLRHHESLTIKSCKEYGYGCIEAFEREFSKIEWIRGYDNRYSDSLFSEHLDSKIHASIIQFNNKGMILKGRDIKIAEKIIRKKLKELPLIGKNATVDWGCNK